MSCVFQYAKIDAEEGGTFDAYIALSTWTDVGLGVAETATAVLVNYIASLSKEEAAKTIIWLALFSVALDVLEDQVLSGSSQALSAVGKVNIPASGFATTPPQEGCTGNEPVTSNSVRKLPSLPIWLLSSLRNYSSCVENTFAKGKLQDCVLL